LPFDIGITALLSAIPFMPFCFPSPLPFVMPLLLPAFPPEAAFPFWKFPPDAATAPAAAAEGFFGVGRFFEFPASRGLSSSGSGGDYV
jgi:hypothetical protein